VDQLQLATLEGDGSISIVAKDGSDTTAASKRRRRYRRRT